jgi:general secretion pathway protein K
VLPYRTPNRYITSASELLALPGFGRDRYLKLAPYVTALPHGTTINVCTASGVLLDAFLGPGHTDFGTDPTTLQKNRQNTTGCFPTLANYQAAFDPKVWAGTASTGAGTTTQGTNQGLGTSVIRGGANSGVNGTPGLQSKFGQTSSYFRLTSVVSIGSTEINLYSLLYQDAQAQMVRPIQRSFTPD